VTVNKSNCFNISLYQRLATCIGSKRSYALTWCMPNNDDDDDDVSKNGINLGRGWSNSSRQTDLASTCGPMHRL